jgi:hypothetical protein
MQRRDDYGINNRGVSRASRQVDRPRVRQRERCVSVVMKKEKADRDRPQLRGHGHHGVGWLWGEASASRAWTSAEHDASGKNASDAVVIGCDVELCLVYVDAALLLLDASTLATYSALLLLMDSVEDTIAELCE